MIKCLLHFANRIFDETSMYKTIMLFKFFRVLILQNTKCIFKLDFLLCIAGIILTNFQIQMEKLHFCYMYKNIEAHKFLVLTWICAINYLHLKFQIFGTFLPCMKIQSNMGDWNFETFLPLMKIQSNMGDWNFASAIAHICQQRDSYMHVNNRSLFL